MNINRYNYEEYFLLYTDNELSAAEKQAVEAFIRQNPDLEKEFTMLQQATLAPDGSIVFSDKDLLMQAQPDAAFIHNENYQEVFVLYSDDELQKDEKTAVEKFVYDHPQYQEEFELIQSLKFNPDSSITFPDKNSLYHRPETSSKPVIFTWGRIAAAASVLIFGAIVWLAQSGSNLSPQLAQTKGKQSPKQRPVVSTTVNGANLSIDSGEIRITPPSSLLQRNDVAHTLATDVKEKSMLAPTFPHTPHLKKLQTNRSATIKSDSKLAATTKQVKPLEPEISKSIQTERANNDVATQVTKPSAQSQEPGNNPPFVHTLVHNQQSNDVAEMAIAADDHSDNISVAGFTIDKKGSIRGLLRKASRIIDKTTSIRPVKKQGLVIGNIEIAFQ
jgi:hypothetical protein